jgi:hypothetical protein
VDEEMERREERRLNGMGWDEMEWDGMRRAEQGIRRSEFVYLCDRVSLSFLLSVFISCPSSVLSLSFLFVGAHVV